MTLTGISWKTIGQQPLPLQLKPLKPTVISHRINNRTIVVRLLLLIRTIVTTTSHVKWRQESRANPKARRTCSLAFAPEVSCSGCHWKTLVLLHAFKNQKDENCSSHPRHERTCAAKVFVSALESLGICDSGTPAPASPLYPLLCVVRCGSGFGSACSPAPRPAVLRFGVWVCSQSLRPPVMWCGLRFGSTWVFEGVVIIIIIIIIVILMLLSWVNCHRKQA